MNKYTLLKSDIFFLNLSVAFSVHPIRGKIQNWTAEPAGEELTGNLLHIENYANLASF